MDKTSNSKKIKERADFRDRLSIFRLLSLDTVSKLGLVFGGMIIAEVLVFCLIGMPDAGKFIEYKVLACRIPLYIICAAGYLLVSLILANALSAKTGKCIYTVQRLKVSEREIFGINVLYNFLMYLVFIGIQVFIMLIMMAIFNANYDAGPQNNMMAIYRTALFHSFFPVGDIYFTLRNILTALCLGILAALQAQKQREGGISYTFYIAVIAAGLCFIIDPYNHFSDSTFRISDGIIAFAIVIMAILGWLSGINHREEQWHDDDFRAAVKEYRNEEETC